MDEEGKEMHNNNVNMKRVKTRRRKGMPCRKR